MREKLRGARCDMARLRDCENGENATFRKTRGAWVIFGDAGKFWG